jgi:sterol desaturase/sphingolipid hydroxylase (fatty acid hydroxylase superfamily)
MDDRPSYRSHLLPRTRDGWIATVAFVLIFLLAEPPIVTSVLNRVQPWVLGMPFLYASLLAVYLALIVVLLWTLWRRV